MKLTKTVLKQIIRKELLNELDSGSRKRADGLVNIRAKKDFLKNAKILYSDLAEDGFETNEILDYLSIILKRILN